jgi:nucleoside-diphosphate-sugar epimerase
MLRPDQAAACLSRWPRPAAIPCRANAHSRSCVPQPDPTETHGVAGVDPGKIGEGGDLAQFSRSPSPDRVLDFSCSPSGRSVPPGADAVFHLAALIAIPYSYHAPRSYVDTKVIGTLNVLEAVRACGTPRMVHTSTSEIYGTARTIPTSEAHPPQAQSPTTGTSHVCQEAAT